MSPRLRKRQGQHADLATPEQALLAQVQAHYQYVFENVNDAIFIHGLTGRFLEVNQVACDRLGYSREELLQMQVQQLDSTEMAAHFEEGMQGLLQKGSVVAESCHI